MSTGKKKKVVVSTGVSAESKQKAERAARAPRTVEKKTAELVFSRNTYIWMLGGVALIFLGMLLMSGGGMASPDEWKPEQIYSFRRTVLAPMVILAGLILEIYAIFKK